MQIGDLAAALAGEDQQTHDPSVWMAQLAGRQPDFSQFVVAQHAIAGALLGGAAEVGAGVDGNEPLAPRPCEERAQYGMQPVGRDWGVLADAVEHSDDIVVRDIADAAGAPTIYQRDPAAAVPIGAAVTDDSQVRCALLHCEPEQARGPFPRTFPPGLAVS